MYESYDTAKNWVLNQEIWGVLADLPLWAWGLIGAIIALPFIIKRLKNRKSKTETILDKAIDGKQVTSNENYVIQIGIFVLMSLVSGVACFNFGNERMGWEGGAIAACISLGIFAACLRNNRKHNRFQTAIEWTVLVPLVLFEMVVIGANFITVGENKPAAAVERDRAEYKAEIVRLTALKIPKAQVKRNVDKYDNRLFEGLIKEEKQKLKDLPKFRNPEGKFYEEAALLLAMDVYLIELLFNIGIGCLLILVQTMTGTRCNSYVCPWTIKRQVNIDKAIALALKGGGVKTEKLESAAGRSGKKRVAHANDSNFEPNVQKMISFLSKKTDGYEVTEKVIRGQTKATDKQIRLIRKQLKTLGWLKAGTNGGATTYVKSTPSLASVETIKRPFWKRG